ncbi:MAG TPA: hypothetical protein VIO59_09200 [Rhodanobacter sp.]
MSEVARKPVLGPAIPACSAYPIAATLHNHDIDAHIRRDFMGGVRSGVNGTPSFYVNGYLYQGDFDSLVHSIGRVIARQA